MPFNNTYTNGIITSIIATIIITSGIGLAFASNTEHFGTLIVGLTNGTNANVASGYNSAAFGTSTTASGNDSIAFGQGTTAKSLNSAAFGAYSTASGNDSAAFGFGTDAQGSDSVAFGYNSVTTGPQSAAFGAVTLASGANSAAFGESTTAKPYGSFVIGRHNEVSGNESSWIKSDPLFVIGNGVDEFNTNNAVTILKNGNMGIGTSTPNSLLQLSEGYLQLDTSTGSPPKKHCNNDNEIGRMKVDDSKPILYICTNYGWTELTSLPFS